MSPHRFPKARQFSSRHRQPKRRRLRVNPICYGGGKDLLIPLCDKVWLIAVGDTGDYFLSGTLTVSPPKAHGRANAWQGTLKLPKTKITLRKP